MKFTNSDIGEYLTNIATAHEIKKQNRFRTLAYENAADVAYNYHRDIYRLWQKDPALLDEIPGFGQAISEKVGYFLKTGKPHPSIQKLFKNIHPAVFTFTKINSIGPVIAHKLTQNLKFSTDPFAALEELVGYAYQDKISGLPGLGERSQASILENTLAFMGRKKRMPLKKAQDLSHKVIDYLASRFPDVQFEVLGSLRRKSETVGDIDIAAASNNSSPIIEYFLQYPDAVQSIAVGEDKASIRLLHDVRIDLMIKPPESFGSLLQHFTGSKQHNIILRKYAIERGYSLSEYGIKDLKTSEIHKFDNETDFYNFLGLKYIPPEKRLGENELELYKIK